MQDIPDHFGVQGSIARQIVTDVREGRASRAGVQEWIDDWRTAGNSELAELVERLLGPVE